MNLKDPILNPVAVDGVVSEMTPEVTIETGGVTTTIKEFVKELRRALVLDALEKSNEISDTLKRTAAASKHNADLLEALEGGGDFRIAFRKPGETDWTRVRYRDEDSLQAAAVEEVATRQACTMKNLADMLGIDEFTLSNI